MSLSPAILKAINDMDAALVKAIDDANAAGLPQGLVVALLSGYAYNETARMIEK